MDLNRLGDEVTNITQDKIVAYSCVRNEESRLPYFLDHHRRIGVDYFILVDNLSTDSTIDFLLSQEDVYVYQTGDSYAENNYGMTWLNHLLSKFGVGNWNLVLDADELFIYPYYERIDLSTLARYLDSIGVNAVKSFLLDMYSNKAIAETNYEPGKPFSDTCPYFDKDQYTFEKSFFPWKKNSVPIRGGVRKRLFWNGFKREKPSPFLKKYPFVKWNKDLEYETSTHIIQDINEADITGVLQHYKLFSDFYEYSKNESQRNEHWDNAAQYKAYRKVLTNNEKVNPFYKGSQQYKNSQQLIDLGLMHSSKKFQKFIKSNNQID